MKNQFWAASTVKKKFGVDYEQNIEKLEIYKHVCNEQKVCSLCENLLISGQGSDMVLGFETKVCLRLHTDAFFQQYTVAIR